MNINKKIEEFWKTMESMQFIKTTNSFTDEVEEFPPAIKDMEAIVDIRGEFDKYGIEDWLKQALLEVQKETARAFGGCTKCYGKGYATTEYFETSRYHKKAMNPVQPCSCDRGKQIAKIIGKDHE